MLRQMEQLGLSNVKVLGSDGICTENLADLSGGAKTLSNVVCAERTASLTKIPGGAAWKARYDAKYPKQFQVYSPYAYDSTMALAQAMIEAGSTDPKIYTAKLAAIRYGGITGNISFGSDGDLARPTLTLYGYQSGRKFETGTFAACAEGTRWCEKLKRCTSTECK